MLQSASFLLFGEALPSKFTNLLSQLSNFLMALYSLGIASGLDDLQLPFAFFNFGKEQGNCSPL